MAQSYTSKYLRRLERRQQPTRSLITKDIPGAQPKSFYPGVHHQSLGFHRKQYNIPQTQIMRNPMFSSYNYSPQLVKTNTYEDALDKLKKSYNINYGLGPSYDDRKLKQNWANFYGSRPPSTKDGQVYQYLREMRKQQLINNRQSLDSQKMPQQNQTEHNQQKFYEPEPNLNQQNQPQHFEPQQQQQQMQQEKTQSRTQSRQRIVTDQILNSPQQQQDQIQQNQEMLEQQQHQSLEQQQIQQNQPLQQPQNIKQLDSQIVQQQDDLRVRQQQQFQRPKDEMENNLAMRNQRAIDQQIQEGQPINQQQGTGQGDNQPLLPSQVNLFSRQRSPTYLTSFQLYTKLTDDLGIK